MAENMDRRVHAHYPGMEIVRYDRAGKWYAEPTDAGERRDQLNIGEAAHLAVARHATWVPGLPGGRAFDRMMRDAFTFDAS